MKKGEHVFRTWLVEKVMQTRWVGEPGETRVDLAKRLGLDPSVLDDAQERLIQRLRSEGRVPRRIGNHELVTSRKELAELQKLPSPRVRNRQRLIEVEMPTVIYDDWVAFLRERDQKSATVLRSLIHMLLSGPTNPRFVSTSWRYHGVKYVVRQKPYWNKVARTWVTLGAFTALGSRASEVGSSRVALARGMITDLLEGKINLRIVGSIDGMWDDETRYWQKQG